MGIHVRIKNSTLTCSKKSKICVVGPTAAKAELFVFPLSPLIWLLLESFSLAFKASAVIPTDTQLPWRKESRELQQLACYHAFFFFP